MKTISYILSIFPMSSYARAGSSDQGGMILVYLIGGVIFWFVSAIVGEKIVGKGKDTAFTMFMGIFATLIIILLIGAILK